MCDVSSTVLGPVHEEWYLNIYACGMILGGCYRDVDMSVHIARKPRRVLWVWLVSLSFKLFHPSGICMTSSLSTQEVGGDQLILTIQNAERNITSSLALHVERLAVTEIDCH